MMTAAIEYIWKAIQESERSDDLPFIDAMIARWKSPARSDVMGRELITAAAADPIQTKNDPLPVVTSPPSLA